MSTIAAAAQTADRIDYWIRRHVIQYCYGTHPSQSQIKFNSARDRRVGLLAIGQCLKDQYDALATPMPRHLTLHSSTNSKCGNKTPAATASFSRGGQCGSWLSAGRSPDWPKISNHWRKENRCTAGSRSGL
jgi:hypothetical protein